MDEQEKRPDELNTLPEDRLIPGEGDSGREEEKVQTKREVYYTVQSLVGVLVAMVLVFTFFGRLILVEGESMEPTLLDGEMLVVRSIAYTPKQGDVVVLSKDGFHNGDAIVKRVIAVGGQTVDIDYFTNTVYVDGVAVRENYTKEWMLQQFYQTLTHIEVPEGSVFVMGDNRNNSDDSRNPALGVVDARLVLGEAVLILFPFSRLKAL